MTATTMTTKVTNSVLNFVDPPISDLVLLEGTFNNVVIGSHVPNEAFFTELTDTSLASPLIGASAGLLTEVFLGTGLAMSGNVLYCTIGPAPAPPPSLYGRGLYGTGPYGDDS